VIFSRTGEVCPGFHVLGSRHTPTYLLEGRRPALFDGGMSFLADLYVDDVRRVLGGRGPEVLFLTHVHFDHCGAVSVLREAFPGLRVAASAEAAEILRRPRALQTIRELNEDACGLAPEIGVGRPRLAPFDPFDVDTVLGDGDEIAIDVDLSVRVVATPGHTRDCLSYYVPQRRILVCSEAAGCADRGGHVTAEFVADYDAYLASLRRLCDLDVDVLCQGHEHVYLGRDVREFLERSLRETERFREWVEELLAAEGGDVGRVVARVKAVQYDPVCGPKQPESAYLLNTEARVRHLAGRRPG
jgi:glyoxylase-like metal-dependent hydrolase (beta-lactamase superfamily II)